METDPNDGSEERKLVHPSMVLQDSFDRLRHQRALKMLAIQHLLLKLFPTLSSDRKLLCNLSIPSSVT